jgi:outer membrane protein assembly factor BamC
MTQRSNVQRSAVITLAMLSLAGCGTINSSFGTLFEPDRVDYKSAGKTATPRLEVPPDLTALQRENRYALPETNRGVATASNFNANAAVAAASQPSAGTQVAPRPSTELRVERDGNQRWLVIKQSPEVLWPQIKEFWQDNGFLINLENPATGIMETDWAENRAKIPQDFLRNALGKALDSLYSTGTRDKFRTRLERNADGSTEVFISHRGAQEVLSGSQNDGNTVWTPRPPEPELEAEFVAKLMTRLGNDGARAKAAVATAAAVPEVVHAKLVKTPSGPYVEVDDTFERAWRRVGLALDRVGFTVEDRDRTQGMYFVRYIDQERDANNKTEKKGFFGNLFSSNKAKPATAVQYRIAVKGGGASSQVSVLNADGRVDQSATSDRILALLNEQLK